MDIRQMQGKGWRLLNVSGEANVERLGDSIGSIPTLRSVAATSVTAQQAPEQRSLLAATLDSFAAAIWVLNAERLVYFMNQAGRDCIARQDDLMLREQRLCFSNPAAMERLTRAVQGVCARRESRDAFCVQGPRFGEPLQVIVSRLIEDPDATTGSGYRALVMATRVDPVGCDDTVMGSMFGLSKSETGVLRSLLGGKTVKECARLRNVAITTVRSQLSSIFAKTNTSTQARLMALAKALPARAAPKE